MESANQTTNDYIPTPPSCMNTANFFASCWTLSSEDNQASRRLVIFLWAYNHLLIDIIIPTIVLQAASIPVARLSGDGTMTLGCAVTRREEDGETEKIVPRARQRDKCGEDDLPCKLGTLCFCFNLWEKVVSISRDPRVWLRCIGGKSKALLTVEDLKLQRIRLRFLHLSHLRHSQTSSPVTISLIPLIYCRTCYLLPSNIFRQDTHHRLSFCFRWSYVWCTKGIRIGHPIRTWLWTDRDAFALQSNSIVKPLGNRRLSSQNMGEKSAAWYVY